MVSPRIGRCVLMTQKVKKNILKLKESSTLAINERSKELIKSGKKIYRFGFGQSPFQIPENVVDVVTPVANISPSGLTVIPEPTITSPSLLTLTLSVVLVV